MAEVSVPTAVTVDKHANLTDPVWQNAEEAPDVVQFMRPADGDGTSGEWTHVSCRRFRD